MPRTAPEPRSTEGYSLPKSLHDRIREEATKRDMNRSSLVRKAVLFYLRAHPRQDDDEDEE